MIERQHAIELVPWAELIDQWPKPSTGKNRPRVRDPARLGKPRSPRRVDVDEIILGSNRRLRVGRCGRVCEKPRIGVVIEDEDAIERLAQLVAIAKPRFERVTYENDLRFGDPDRVRQGTPMQVCVDQCRGCADAGNAEDRRDVERRVLRKESDDITTLHARRRKHVRDS